MLVFFQESHKQVDIEEAQDSGVLFTGMALIMLESIFKKGDQTVMEVN